MHILYAYTNIIIFQYSIRYYVLYTYFILKSNTCSNYACIWVGILRGIPGGMFRVQPKMLHQILLTLSSVSSYLTLQTQQYHTNTSSLVPDRFPKGLDEKLEDWYLWKDFLYKLDALPIAQPLKTETLREIVTCTFINFISPTKLVDEYKK